MRTFVLIAVFGAMGLSPFLWSGTAEARDRPPQAPDPCSELRLQIEQGEADPVGEWPEERILLGLFCAWAGEGGVVPMLPVPGVDVLPDPQFDLDMRALRDQQNHMLE